MKLQAEGGRGCMVEGHDGAVVGGGGIDDELCGERGRLCDEAVVSAHGHALVRGIEEAGGRNLERGGLAVPRRGRPADPAAERVDDALVAEADAEDGQVSVIGADEVEGVGRLLRCAGPGANENRSGGRLASRLASSAPGRTTSTSMPIAAKAWTRLNEKESRLSTKSSTA